VQLYGF